MAHVSKDIKSALALIKTCHSRVVTSRDPSLTSIQRQQSETRVRQSLADDGITYAWSGDDDNEGLTCMFTSLYISDFGVIIDVAPVGDHPIHLSASENVSIFFEPRDLSQVDSFQYSNLCNAKFANLKKGDSFTFAGRVTLCQYLLI